MSRALPLLLALLAGPFWETKSPREWTAEELAQMFHDSPWAQVITVQAPAAIRGGVPVYLATAEPMREAEAEARRRAKKPGTAEEAGDEDYQEFLKENPGKHIVLAVRLPDPMALSDARESSRMEEECILKIGRRKYRMVGHFPPTPRDPWLRLIYPRALEPQDKRLSFELYLPSAPSPYRQAEFSLRDLTYRGKPEL